MNKNNRFAWNVTPVYKGNGIISGDKYRFTALTSRLFRLEYSENGIFENRASQIVFNREFEECFVKSTISNGIVTFETDDLILNYNENEFFSKDSLSIKLKNEPASIWCYGEEFETLGGTIKTLDQTNGEVELGDGVCSRNGFSVIDDSNSYVLDETGWIDVRNSNNIDIYFFGYGFDYLDAVKDLYRLTGTPPMLPNYALGNWWSRCHKYSQQEYIDMIDKFKEVKVPLTVAVIDFDWHIREIPAETRDTSGRHYGGWTGYTWNRSLFPDYKEFLKYLHECGLKTSLNLHPADGVCPHEEMYPEMAKACGVDISTNKRVPFNVLSKDYMEKYFDILHHPYENDGIDFWWIDWQQGGSCKRIIDENPDYKFKSNIVNFDPLWLLNHLHTIDISRTGKRPILFSRYSGIGSHRYPVGFSGDTYITWKNLDFQPYFTSTASNVGYGWWSHDIGGFMRGYYNPELFVRWLQFGVFSPINRLHSSSVGGKYIHKMPWTNGEPYDSITKKWMRLRHKLFPYIYTMNYRNHKELEPIIQPMYYSYPKKSAAYDAKNQYMFGSELMVRPITEPICDFDGLASAPVWLPKGNWFDFFNGLHYYSEKDCKVTVFRNIETTPVFAKSGAIVPLIEDVSENDGLKPKEKINVIVFPGASNSFTMYEDSGDGFEFENGEFATTEFSLNWGDQAEFVINAPQGYISLLPQKRTWDISFRGFNKEVKIEAFTNENPVNVVSKYDNDTLTVNVTIEAKITDNVKFVIYGKELISNNVSVDEHLFKILDRSRMSVYRKMEYEEKMLNKTKSFKEKMLDMGSASSLDDQHLYDAVVEMLSLKKHSNENDDNVSNLA